MADKTDKTRTRPLSRGQRIHIRRLKQAARRPEIDSPIPKTRLDMDVRIMTTGMIIAVVFLGIIAINRRQVILEKLIDVVEYMGERKHVLRKRVPAAITKLGKLRVVKTLADEQIPKVKKQIDEICILINRRIEAIHQVRDSAVAFHRSSGLTAGRMQYEKEYARQVDMINAAVPRLITEADRISAFDEEYKQQIHDWILAMRKSLEDEDCDPKYFEQMARVSNAYSQNSQ